MKHSWLFFGCVACVVQWMDHPFIKGIFLLVMAMYYWRHYRNKKIGMSVLLIMLMVCLLPNNIQKPVAKTMHVKEIRSNYVIADNGEQKMIVYHAGDVSFDDIIEVEGTFQYVDTIHNIRTFSFTTWLHRRGIYYQITADHSKVIEEGKSLRHKLYQKIKKRKDKKQRTWLQMMLYGIHEEEVTYFVTSSGMHISYLFYLIEKLLLMFLSKELALLLVLLGIGSCGYVSVFSASLLRVLCFRLVRFVFPTQTNDDSLGISMLVVLFLFPYMAFELAFILPVSFRLLQMFNVQKRKKLLTSFFVLIPVQYLYFHVCNPIQVVLFRYIRIWYAVLYAICWLLVVLPSTWLLNISIGIYNVLQSLGEWGFSMYYTPSFWWLLAWLYYVGKYISFQDQSKYALCALLLYAPFASYADPFGEIVMIDVGQGDCTLLKLPFHQGVMLIDVMGSLYKNIPNDIIVPLLKAKGIHALDKVIITHQDYDHSGGLEELSKLMPIKEVIQTKQADTYLGSLHIPFVISDYQGSDENENSIITYIDVYGLRVLFMGDAGKEAEQVLIQQYPNLQVDVLKVGHHGSKTSSSLEFLHSLQPSLALISAGRNNRYHHPNEETLERLRQENIYSLITSKNGGISIKFCKYFAFFRTADNEFGIIKNR